MHIRAQSPEGPGEQFSLPSGVSLCFADFILPSSFVRRVRGIITTLYLLRCPREEKKNKQESFSSSKSLITCLVSLDPYTFPKRDTRCLPKKCPWAGFRDPLSAILPSASTAAGQDCCQHFPVSLGNWFLQWSLQKSPPRCSRPCSVPALPPSGHAMLLSAALPPSFQSLCQKRDIPIPPSTFHIPCLVPPPPPGNTRPSEKALYLLPALIFA